MFPRLTAREHLLAALQEFQPDGFAARLLRLPSAARAEADADRRARALLQWVGLAEATDCPATSLSYGQRKLLAFAMALAPAPRLLMLDEPMAGVSPILIEHNLTVVMTLCQRLVVLDHGQKIAEGPPQVVRETPAVIEAYFGA